MSNSEKRAELDRQFRQANPEPARENLDLFSDDPASAWEVWDAARRQAILDAVPWDESDEADLASRGTILPDGTVTY
jgi:hypothetical protein